MRHLPWFRIGTAFVVVATLVLLGKKYVSSPAAVITGKLGRGVHAADDPLAGRTRNEQNPSGVAAADQRASRPDQTLGEAQRLDDAVRLREPVRAEEHTQIASDTAVPEKLKNAAAPKAVIADSGSPKTETKNRLSNNPEVLDNSVGGDIDDNEIELPLTRSNAFQGLPLNIPVNIKVNEKPSVVPNGSGPPKEASLDELKRYFEPDMTSKQFNATVLIATPLRNARGHLKHYFDLLRSLNYPHHLISVALGEDSSNDGTYELAKSLAKTELSDFQRVSIFHLDHVLHQGTDWSSVHAEGHQLERRSHMARARNELLSRALDDEDFVLWVDSDVGTWPADIVQHLLDAGVDVVAPVCMWRSAEGRVDVYDRNTWRETAESLARQQQRGDDYLMLEGYGNSPRLYLPDLRGERERLVKVDGVGGCVLLVRAVAHRRGLVFPPFVFRHHVETEGLAKMATAMGYKCYGMPFLEVFHL